jgi:hypothetical protein
MNTIGGNCTNAAVAAALDLDWVDPMKVVSA